MKTICVYHSRDLDGWVSAAIVKKWFLDNNGNKHSFINDLQSGNKLAMGGDTLSLLGWDYGDNIPDLSDYDKVIMCDISFPANKMYKLKTQMEGKLIWIDHHISAINACEQERLETNMMPITGVQDPNLAACELTWNYFFPKQSMPKAVNLLGLYDSFRHKKEGNEELVMNFQYYARANASGYKDIPEWWLSDNIPYGIEQISDYDIYLGEAINSGKEIYKYLCVDAKQVYDKAFPIEFENPDYDTINHHPELKINLKFLCVNQERFNPINFGIDYHKDGYDGFACFWLKDSKWNFSLYNDNEKVDCSIIAKQYGGGGHFSAAGMITDSETMIKIINNG